MTEAEIARKVAARLVGFECGQQVRVLASFRWIETPGSGVELAATDDPWPSLLKGILAHVVCRVPWESDTWTIESQMGGFTVPGRYLEAV